MWTVGTWFEANRSSVSRGEDSVIKWTDSSLFVDWFACCQKKWSEVFRPGVHRYKLFTHILTSQVGALLWALKHWYFNIYMCHMAGGGWWSHHSKKFLGSVSRYSYSFCIHDSVWSSSVFLIGRRIRLTRFVFLSSVPNRYTFTCPYCNCPNLDQDGLIEHCTSHHARDARQVVGNSLSHPLRKAATF